MIRKHLIDALRAGLAEIGVEPQPATVELGRPARAEPRRLVLQRGAELCEGRRPQSPRPGRSPGRVHRRPIHRPT